MPVAPHLPLAAKVAHVAGAAEVAHLAAPLGSRHFPVHRPAELAATRPLRPRLRPGTHRRRRKDESEYQGYSIHVSTGVRSAAL